MSFATLGLSPAVLRALVDEGYTQPTAVQESSIPLILAGHDLQTFLGDDQFVARMQRKGIAASDDVNIPKAQRRRPAATLAAIGAKHKSRPAAMVAAHATGQYSYSQIAKHFDVHFTTVGRAVRLAKAARR